MNKLLILTKSVIIAIGMVGIVNADNTWTGFYAGAELGLIVNDIQLKSQHLGFTDSSETCNHDSIFFGFTPGLQLGYLYQFPNDWVTGLELGVAFNTNQNETSSCNSEFNPDVYDGFTFRNQMQTAIKGRIGHVMNWKLSTLFSYVTVGASFANAELMYKNEGGDHYSNLRTQAGWLVGLGLEWAFMQKWSLRAEYNYVNYGNSFSMTIPSVTSVRMGA